MNPSRLSRIIVAIFLFAVVMGAGPGLFLVNPDPAGPSEDRFVAGVPVVYAWAVLWLGVQAVCVIVAYRKLWKEAPEPKRGEEESR